MCGVDARSHILTARLWGCVCRHSAHAEYRVYSQMRGRVLLVYSTRYRVYMLFNTRNAHALNIHTFLVVMA
jgi:hypothetical protein